MSRALAFLAGLLALAAPARANVLVGPGLELAGETVYAKLDADAAEVSGVYEFTDWNPGEEIYFPIFSDGTASRAAAFRAARMVVRIGETNLPNLKLSNPPDTIWQGGAVPHVIWVKIQADDDAAMALLAATHAVRIAVDYVQPLIHGRFYYLPVMPKRVSAAGGQPSAWPYQLMVRHVSRVPNVESEGVRSQRLGEAVVVYLQDRQLVAIK